MINTTLTQLDLSSNWNTTIDNKEHFLNEKKWTGNKIGLKGAIKISESLMINTSLTKLNLRGDWNKASSRNNTETNCLFTGNSISGVTKKALGIWCNETHESASKNWHQMVSNECHKNVKTC